MTDDELSALREKMALVMAKTMGGWNDDISEVGIDHEPTRKALEAHWARVNEQCLKTSREYADAILSEFDVTERMTMTDDELSAFDNARAALAGVQEWSRLYSQDHPDAATAESLAFQVRHLSEAIDRLTAASADDERRERIRSAVRDMQEIDRTEEEATADEARVMAEAYLKSADVYDRAHEPEEIARQAYVEGYTKAHRLATDEYDRIITLQGDLLRCTVNALRGDPPHLMNWSHHDVVDLAKAAVEALAQQYVLDAGFEWEDMDETTKAHYRTQARAEIQVVEL